MNGRSIPIEERQWGKSITRGVHSGGRFGGLYFLVVCLIVFLSLGAPARASEIRDFLLMDVCVDDADRILPNLVPGDRACRRRRDIRHGETPPYRLRNFRHQTSVCSRSPSAIFKENFLLTLNGVTRVVSSYSRETDVDCRGAPLERSAASDGGSSVQWHDSEFAFIMGSWSPVSLSSFVTPACANAIRSSERFFRGWVIAPVDLLTTRRPGFGAFQSAHSTSQPDSLMESCPVRFRKALTTWHIHEVTYRSGVTLDSIVSNHYAQVDRSGSTPGAAMQVERTYWTREFGLTRWEKWARMDWRHIRSGETAPELAKRVRASGRCSSPPRTKIIFNQDFSIQPSENSDFFLEQIEVREKPPETRWVMTLCEDYTNVVRENPPSGMATHQPPQAYWQ
jgi:hypothetical protein